MDAGEEYDDILSTSEHLCAMECADEEINVYVNASGHSPIGHHTLFSETIWDHLAGESPYGQYGPISPESSFLIPGEVRSICSDVPLDDGSAETDNPLLPEIDLYLECIDDPQYVMPEAPVVNSVTHSLIGQNLKWKVSFPANQLDQSGKKSERLKCSECARTFSKESHMKQHLVVKHGKNLKFNCQSCGFVTDSNRNLLRHVRRKHKGDHSVVVAKKPPVRSCISQLPQPVSDVQLTKAIPLIPSDINTNVVEKSQKLHGDNVKLITDHSILTKTLDKFINKSLNLNLHDVHNCASGCTDLSSRNGPSYGQDGNDIIKPTFTYPSLKPTTISSTTPFDDADAFSPLLTRSEPGIVNPQGPKGFKVWSTYNLALTGHTNMRIIAHDDQGNLVRSTAVPGEVNDTTVEQLNEASIEGSYSVGPLSESLNKPSDALSKEQLKARSKEPSNALPNASSSVQSSNESDVLIANSPITESNQIVPVVRNVTEIMEETLPLKEYHPYTCSECPFTCLVKRDASAHCHTMILTCYVCKNTFNSHIGLKKHVLRFHSDVTVVNVHKCTYANCQRTFKLQCDLREHLSNIHNLGELMKCSHPGCGKIFKCRRSLKKHFDTHTDKWLCPWIGCGKRFRDRYNLDVHYSSHTGYKRNQCLYCDYTCIQKASMNWHMKKKHASQKNTGKRKTAILRQSETTLHVEIHVL